MEMSAHVAGMSPGWSGRRSITAFRPTAFSMAAATRCTIDHHVIDGANHYYFGQPSLAQQAAETVRDWIAGQG